MAETTVTTAAPPAKGLNIPEETQKKFPEFVGLIKNSQSMNEEERQYWVDVLPIMTEDQLNNLKSILDNEKKQLEEVNKEYDQGVKEDARKFNLKFDEIKYKEKKRILAEEEEKDEEEDKKREDAALAELANL